MSEEEYDCPYCDGGSMFIFDEDGDDRYLECDECFAEGRLIKIEDDMYEFE